MKREENGFYVAINGNVVNYKNKRVMSHIEASRLAILLADTLHKEANIAVKKNDAGKFIECVLSSANLFIVPYNLH